MNQKKVFKKFIFICAVLANVGACSLQDTNLNPPLPYTAQVLRMQPLNSGQLPNEKPTFILGNSTFQFLENVNELDGKYFKIHSNSLINIDQNGNFFTEFISSPLPLHYDVNHKVIIPKDYNTLAMLSTYYQFDYIAQNIHFISDLMMEDLFKKFGKINILFEPHMNVQDEAGNELRLIEKLNAAYHSNSHQFILFRRSGLENIPLSFNLQIIAHEFGHMLWHVYFEEGRSNKLSPCDFFDTEYAIRGLNEGFADFVSYTLTGSTDIIANSFSFLGKADTRNFYNVSFDYDKIRGDEGAVNTRLCRNDFYCLGTLFAHALFLTQKNLGYDQHHFKTSDSRGTFLKEITRALQNTQKSMVRSNVNCRVTNAAAQLPSMQHHGEILGLFFQSFLTQLAFRPSLQIELCQQLKNQFGNQGFPQKYRLAVACP